ncbi:DUF485 domain-containing protein [Lysinibacillus endophyticus]|uniref:DUF485 domain-containing protein n=1 Tax=Ureibacillus endophyticus TaxID=1978490 RepID=A0A494Z2I8_9BACL|nr:DUF485 domain-containing protein [Lysinibacillus endophyticus]MCP1144735.1 DUF485 domain-containing protein [Lysinibacillus endophyticus]RKQ16706.1 DUF485 domain-containing protein [Lysinibacillus endophyticus]
MANVGTLNKPVEKEAKPAVNNVKIKDINYSKINQMESFNGFVKKKNTFLFGVTAAFLTLYILLPILAFTPVLQQKWIGNITGVWVYSAALFIMTVVLCMLYTKMAPKFDKMAAEVLAEYERDGGR